MHLAACSQQRQTAPDSMRQAQSWSDGSACSSGMVRTPAVRGIWQTGQIKELLGQMQAVYADNSESWLTRSLGADSTCSSISSCISMAMCPGSSQTSNQSCCKHGAAQCSRWLRCCMKDQKVQQRPAGEQSAPILVQHIHGYFGHVVLMLVGSFAGRLTCSGSSSASDRCCCC